MLTLQDYITSSGKYPDRAKSPELTQEVLDNAEALLKAVNALLKDLGIKNPKVSSGFRPSYINSAIPNAAKRSLHMRGLAIDLEDFTGQLDLTIEKNYDLLEKYGLWLEHPETTKGWCHLDKGTRSARKVRVFKP